MTTTARKVLLGLCAGMISFTLVATAQQQMPKTTKQSITGSSSTTTNQLRGTVVFVEGNRLAVKMSSGDIRYFEPPESRRFLVDGKELTVQELKPGTTLTATVTTTATSVTDRTTTVGTGKVWFVSGNNVILTLPNNENRQYKVKDDYRFIVNGQKATVFDLRKGMVVSAEKIVEEPRTEIASNTTVTGHAPPAPRPQASQTTAALEQPKSAPVTRASAEPTSSPAPAPAAAAEPAATTAQTELPATGSAVPLIGLAGLLFTGASLCLQQRRRFASRKTRV